jgi:hypothetical protein
MSAVRYQETINGHRFVIEVLHVSTNRWRAQLLRRPDRATSLMPFYGPTPEDAAKLLRGWLTRTAKAAPLKAGA